MRTPPGYRAELIDEKIILRPPPDPSHETVMGKIIWRVARNSREELAIAVNPGLIIPSGRRMPGLTVGSTGMLAGHGVWRPPEDVLLVVEVTSDTPRRNRIDKRRGDAATGIPLYLLVDRQERTVVLHSDPDADTGDYLTIHNAPYSKDVPLPALCDFAIETADLQGLKPGHARRPRCAGRVPSSRGR